MYSTGGDIVGWIGVIFFFIAIAACCCTGDDKGTQTKSGTTTTRKTTTSPRRNVYYGDDCYSECPSCGAPYYDGYCEECGYPDINQGWIGENY